LICRGTLDFLWVLSLQRTLNLFHPFRTRTPFFAGLLYRVFSWRFRSAPADLLERPNPENRRVGEILYF
jgi:hypothetical protein